jgi:hypothetical protein
MQLIFERGSSSSPRGHVLLYFRDAANPNEIYATYLVVLPIPIELSKYVPPMMAGKIPHMDAKTISAVPLPPIPERVENVSHLQAMAEAREDDLIDCGSFNTSDVEAAMSIVSDIAQRYAEMWAERVSQIHSDGATSAEVDEGELDVNAVMYGLMSEQQRLAELTKLAGRLRYAVDGQDKVARNDVLDEIKQLDQHLPEKYDLGGFVEVAQQPGEKGARLAQLYIDRYFKLYDEKYEDVRKIDEEIASLTG